MDIELFRHGARVHGALDLLGTDEVAHTTAVGWTLASPSFASALVENVTGARGHPPQPAHGHRYRTREEPTELLSATARR